MTYDDVAAWVEENFDVGNYLSPQELIADVKDRFQKDGMYYPEKAGENINNVWREQMGLDQYQPSLEDLQRQRYEAIQTELDQKIKEFFGNQPEQVYQEYEPVIYGPTEPEQPSSISEQGQPQGVSGFFRSVGSRLRRFFGR